MRFRHIYTIVGSLFVLALWLFTDPDLGFIQNMEYGASTLATLVIMAKALLYVTLLHYSRKALFDYLDLEEHFIKTKEEPVASGLALIAVSIFAVAIAIVIYAGTVG